MILSIPNVLASYWFCMFNDNVLTQMTQVSVRNYDIKTCKKNMTKEC